MAALEGVGRQLGPLRRAVGESGQPVDGPAVRVQPGQRPQQLGGSGRSRRSVGVLSAGPVGYCSASAASVPPGPTSTNVSAPASRNAVIPSPNRTASRTCRTQYSGEHS